MEHGLGISDLMEAEMKSPIVLLEGLLADASRLMPGVKGLDRDIITIKSRFEHEGYGFLTIALPSLCDALDRGLALGKFACPTGFSKTRGGAIPRIFSGMLCKVFAADTGLLVQSPDSHSVKMLREILRLFKKLVLTQDQETYLDLQARSKFIQDDEACQTENSFSDRQQYVLDTVCRYILPNLDGVNFSELRYKHGPGAVFEHYKPNQKWNGLLTYSGKLDRLGYDCTYFSNEGAQLVIDDQLAEYGASGDIARLVTVAKSSTSRRTITVEPLVRQFVQQGLNTHLRREIDSCGILRQCLALTDQSKNQHLALEGSRTGEWSTIDLRAASDLLSIRIVNQIFRSRPLFLEELLDCRSPNVDTGSSVIALRKFAGMGNATTFPVQSVTFAVLAICALLEGVKPSYGNVQRVARQIRVYGDDIIVRTKSVHQVMAWLNLAGLAVNENKSFTVGNFRESCGVDAFMGVDVTPLYVRHWPVQPSLKEPSIIAHLVSLSNQAWFKGLYSMSEVIREWVDSSLRKPLPLLFSNSSALGWHSRQETTTFQRWNPLLHREEVLAPVLCPLKRSDRLDGYAALLKFFHVPLLGRGRDHLEKSPVKFKSRISLRWVPSLS